VDRRTLLKSLSAAGALSILPSTAEAAWRDVAAASVLPTAPFRALTASQAASVGALADTLLPRTDSPSATDVGVLAWIDVVLAGYYTPDEKKAFDDGLAAIEAMRMSGDELIAAETAEGHGALIAALEAMDRRQPAARGWWRIKGLVIHGYFTSKPVQQDVLKNEIMPGKFVGDAPHKVGAAK
jgi:hypothetical protein